jgi:hypothetical protein
MRFDLIDVWWSALYGQEGKPNCALALHAQDTRCENLGFVDITNEAAVFPAEMNVLLVMQSDHQLVPSPVLLRALQNRPSPTVLMLGRPSKSGLNVLKWWIDHDNCEVAHTPLQSDELSFAPHSISEALCVGTASVVSLVLLVIIAVALLPTAPTLP